MWRNSLSLYSRLVLSRNPNPNPAFLASSSISSLDAFIRPFSIASDGARALGSAVNTTSLSAGAALDLANHYGRCYWELSKARLRLGFSIQAFFFFFFLEAKFSLMDCRIKNIDSGTGLFWFFCMKSIMQLFSGKEFGFNKFRKRIIVFFCWWNWWKFACVISCCLVTFVSEARPNFLYC